MRMQARASVAAPFALCAVLATPALAQEITRLKGRIVGERSAKAGKTVVRR